MNKNTNAMPEAQAKSDNYNLLMPSSSSVQLNPFYKCTIMEVKVDTSENTGDIFPVGRTKTGVDQYGKAIYEDVYSLAKPILMKMGTAAGIQFHPEYTTVYREGENTYIGKAYGAVRLPDGSFKTYADTKQICLDDEESKYKIEFMDKSIKGITDEKQAAAAAEMFKGTWKEATNKWGKPCKAYVIADEDREKYIERSVLVNMTLLRKTASEKAQTGAILRVIRALLGIKGTYTMEELKKPFAVSSVTFAPDYTDATVRQAMLQQGMNSMSNIFGTVGTAHSAPALRYEAEAFDDNFNVMSEIDNPAFATDESIDEQEAYEQEPYSVPEEEDEQGTWCSNCGETITPKVYDFSVKKWGRPLCYNCQKGVAK